MRFAIVVFIFLTGYSQAMENSNETVENTKKNCRCIRITDCPPLLEVLKKGGQDSMDTLLPLSCGNDGKIPKVCCPSGNEVSDDYSCKKNEKCLEYSNCPSFIKFLEEGKVEISSFESLICGFNEREPKLCCPDSDEN